MFCNMNNNENVKDWQWQTVTLLDILMLEIVISIINDKCD